MKIPERDGKSIRPIDLATHASGLPRDAEDKPGETVPTSERSKEDYMASLTRGLRGEFSFVAFAPSRGVVVFVSINEFSVGGFEATSKAAVELITELAPR